jgi:hypothetical protein
VTGARQNDPQQRTHDVRNHLSVIIGYCDLLLPQLQEHDPMRADIAEMRKAAAAAIALLLDCDDTR